MSLDLFLGVAGRRGRARPDRLAIHAKSKRARIAGCHGGSIGRTPLELCAGKQLPNQVAFDLRTLHGERADVRTLEQVSHSPEGFINSPHELPSASVFCSDYRAQSFDTCAVHTSWTGATHLVTGLLIRCVPRWLLAASERLHNKPRLASSQVASRQPSTADNRRFSFRAHRGTAADQLTRSRHWQVA